MLEKQVGVYPGTFDPITNGHLDIIIRAATKVVDHLIVAVAMNAGKGPLYTVEERCKMVEDEITKSGVIDPANVEVQTFDNLLLSLPQMWAPTSSLEDCARSRISSMSFKWRR